MSRFKKRHTSVGARPGTLVTPAGTPAPRIRVTVYSEDELQESEVDNVGSLPGYLEQGTVTWVDVHGLGDESVLRRIAEIFELHPLALEDVVNVPQRPKLEPYDAHLLVVTRMVRIDNAANLDIEQISIFIGHNYVLTFQERYGDVLDPIRERIRRGKGVIRKLGPDYLAYALLDTVIDAYYPILERIGDMTEALEDQIDKQRDPNS